MGFLDHLFKPKPSDEKMGEGEKDGVADPAEKNDPSVFLQPKEYVPRAGNHAPLRSSLSGGRKPANGERQEIVITLGDVLSRIPTQLLQSGLIDGQRELRFSIDDLSADIARGRAAVPLSKIAALCPGVFSREITAEDDIEVRLPLQKLVEQIGQLRGRPMVSPAKPLIIAPNPPPQEMAKTADGENIELHLAPISPSSPQVIIAEPLPTNTENVAAPSPIPEISANLPGSPPPAPVAMAEPVDAESLEAADAQVALAEFLAHAEDQPCAPAAANELHSKSAHEPPFAMPDAAGVAAQTPAADAPDSAAQSAEPALLPEVRLVFAEAPTPPVYVPPTVNIAPPDVVAESETSPVKDLASTEQRSATAAAIPPVMPAVLFVHPPPPVRPILVQPPPIFATVPTPVTLVETAPATPVEPPATDESPPPPAVFLTSASYNALQSLFMTDESLDLAAVCRHAAALPGVQGCAIAQGEAHVAAGLWPESFDLSGLRFAVLQFEKAAGFVADATTFGGWQNLALHGETTALSLFTRPSLLLAVFHRPLPPGVRERLATVATELARA